MLNMNIVEKRLDKLFEDAVGVTDTVWYSKTETMRDAIIQLIEDAPEQPKNERPQRLGVTEALRDRYGRMANNIGIRRTNNVIGDRSVYLMSIEFYTQFAISEKLDEQSKADAMMAEAYKLCETVDCTVLNREINADKGSIPLLANMRFHRTRSIPEGIAYLHPQTYYEMAEELRQ